MAPEPDTRYAQTEDGAHLAFQVAGEGPHDLVLTANMIPLDSAWEEPDVADAIDGLASAMRVILYDPRGFGASDALPHDRLLTVEESMADLATVMDAAGSRKTFIFKTDNIAPAVLLAATSPERVAGLVLFNAYARIARAPDYTIGFPDTLLSLYIESVESGPRELAIEVMCRPRLSDKQFCRWFLAAYRRGASPRAAMALVPQDFATDARHVLPLVQAPTLVLHTAENPYIRATHGRYLADHIAGARYKELPGDGHCLATVDLTRVVDEVTEFVTGTPRRPRLDRVFATVLFSDIVASTERAVRVGDARWKVLLDQHDVLVGRQLDRFGGRLVKMTGDGVVATFDGPARAVSCATAIRDGLRRLEIDVRIGIHAGEVILRGDDVTGISVHVASRVQSRADPAEILATQTVVDLVAGSGLRFDPVEGNVELKGVPGRWQLFAVSA